MTAWKNKAAKRALEKEDLTQWEHQRDIDRVSNGKLPWDQERKKLEQKLADSQKKQPHLKKNFDMNLAKKSNHSSMKNSITKIKKDE